MATEQLRWGVSPLCWTNDVLEDLGGDIPLDTCLREAREAGYQGIELGRKFPRQASTLGPLLAAADLRLASGWRPAGTAACWPTAAWKRSWRRCGSTPSSSGSSARR